MHGEVYERVEYQSQLEVMRTSSKLAAYANLFNCLLLGVRTAAYGGPKSTQRPTASGYKAIREELDAGQRALEI